MPISSLLNENLLRAAMISFLEKFQFQADINFVTYIVKKKIQKTETKRVTYYSYFYILDYSNNIYGMASENPTHTPPLPLIKTPNFRQHYRHVKISILCKVS
jgi:hypothetical protein